MSDLTVVGLGSELSGDDGVGLVLVELLRGQLSGDDARHVRCLCWPDADALTIAHELLELQGGVLLVDCAEMGLPPGTWRVFGREQVRLSVKHGCVSVHGVGLAEGLDLAARLGLRGPVRLFAVQPFRADPGTSLSAEMERRLPALVDGLEQAVRAGIGGRQRSRPDAPGPAAGDPERNPA